MALQERRWYRSASSDAEHNYRKKMALVFVAPMFLVAALGGVVVGVVVGKTGGMAAFVVFLIAQSCYLEWKVGSRPVRLQPNTPTKRRDGGVTVVDRDYQG